VGLAFDGKYLAFGARLKAIFSSDIGHWDVPDMTTVLAEAYELVEHGLLNEGDFRAPALTMPRTCHVCASKPRRPYGDYMIKKRQMVVEEGDEGRAAAELFYSLAA
jgi:hypothetical protein